MKIRKRFSIIRKIGLSFIIILVVYLLINNPDNHRLIQKIIPPAGNIRGPEWGQPLRARVDTMHLLCGHRDSIVFNRGDGRSVKKTITSQHYTVQKQGRMLVYRTKKRDRCSSCGNHQFITISVPNVVVKYGTPIKPGPVRETLRINLNRLPNSERDDLMRGIPFRDDKEKLQIIEGLSELIGKP